MPILPPSVYEYYCIVSSVTIVDIQAFREDL